MCFVPVIFILQAIYEQPGKFDDQSVLIDKNLINRKLIFSGMSNFIVCLI